MNLIFSPFILATFGLMVFLLQVNIFDSKTDWLEGMEMSSSPLPSPPQAALRSKSATRL